MNTREKVRELHQQRLSVINIADRLQVSRQAVYSHLWATGLKQRRKRTYKKLSNEERNEQIEKLYLEAMPVKKIAICLHLAPKTVNKHIDILGIRRTLSQILQVQYQQGRESPLLKADDETLKRLHDEGMTTSQIANKLGYKGTGNVSLRLTKLGVALDRTRHGEEHGSWKGGRYVNNKGYALIWDPTHPRANIRHYVLEHIAVWEEYHGHKLPDGYVIHHLNGIKTDNRPVNLVAMKRGAHTSHHLRLHVGQHKKRIRQLEIENRQLKRALEDSQMIFYVSEN